MEPMCSLIETKNVLVPKISWHLKPVLTQTGWELSSGHWLINNTPNYATALSHQM